MRIDSHSSEIVHNKMRYINEEDGVTLFTFIRAQDSCDMTGQEQANNPSRDPNYTWSLITHQFLQDYAFAGIISFTCDTARRSCYEESSSTASCSRLLASILHMECYRQLTIQSFLECPSD